MEWNGQKLKQSEILQEEEDTHKSKEDGRRRNDVAQEISFPPFCTIHYSPAGQLQIKNAQTL